ncbi:sialidase family protein [Leeuwenhoekiella sp. MAR_2009_132]|uniref:sialidase family protein n=1 Tax=Leeuwenhoekiella sp. MAR_2009_132 TaxID=1392489 RepID=UPI00056B27FE|nr:sialidase family protein [Leeuwenhoekiella sp. MAR_2009_132]
MFLKFKFFLVASVLFSSCAEKKLPEVEVLENAFIYNKSDFPQCHASTLVETEEGTIIAAWFGGEYERHPNVSIYQSFKSDSGWSTPSKIADGKTPNDTISNPTWNPVLFKNQQQELLLFYKEGPSPSSWWGMLKRSNDDGKTWSDAIRLPEGILGPIKNKPIQLDSGVIVSPSSIESEDGNTWKSHVELSSDQGKTWQRVAIPSADSVKVIQPTLVQLKKGTLKALLRSDQNYVLESISTDAGKSWSVAKPGTVLNPNSGIDAVTLDGGGFLLVYNPAEAGKDWSDGRNKLNLAYSADGTIWEDILKLEDEEKGEFSYPAIIQDSKGFIHLTYTHNRSKIKYMKLRLNN